ncbi:hypothetical protein AYO20_07878 [Fonsecaea nubica]|uniref:Transcription factor domain-containing protein n=1 Tax=Fonsecaea nubica TaxID=856822 RepID=A0A178CRU7_9EURO|nr:hypothetical protein AYO20_07878 [Fonsecaea nubica]OAL32568.1 hypothetical protein AYO20_07878 [Fonsecaea nubica]
MQLHTQQQQQQRRRRYARISRRERQNRWPTNCDDGHSDRQRVQKLEARMEQIVDAVNTLVELQSGQSSARLHGTSTPRLSASSILSQEEIQHDGTAHPSVSRFDPLHRLFTLTFAQLAMLTSARPDPPPDVLQTLVKLYLERIADQPLPLFDVKRLPSRAQKFSRGLLRSFLALTVRYSDSDFYSNSRSRAVDFYKNSASELLFAQAAEPSGDLETLMAFCLLCLSEIAGVAVRMAVCSNTMFNAATSTTVSANPELSRCCWSVFILDRMHGSSFRCLPAISTEEAMPEMPPVAKRPSLTLPNRLAEFEGAEEKDAGINSYALQLLSIWGRLMSYLKTIKQGNLEEPWAANSVYQQIKSEMSRFETVLPEAHRFKNNRFHDRTPSELEEQRAYWAAWVFTQCIYHTIHCTLNHPFLHIARIPGRPRLRSPSFLQHATDQAVLHSAWVVLVLRLCEEKHFTIFDPFVGHLASMITTAQFFLKFSKDESLAARASKDFEMLRSYVDKMANTHSHLLHTVSKLSRLAQFATSHVYAASNSPPKVETALLWDLLDYAVSSSPVVDSGDSSDNVELNDTEMPSMWLTDMQKVGVAFCSGGGLFLFGGVLMFFDRSMLAMGNILFLIGLTLIIGFQKTFVFFARRQKLKGTAAFMAGILLILIRWPLTGFLVELYGIFVLFGDFFATIASFAGNIPIVGPYIQMVLQKISSGRRNAELPV